MTEHAPTPGAATGRRPRRRAAAPATRVATGAAAVAVTIVLVGAMAAGTPQASAPGPTAVPGAVVTIPAGGASEGGTASRVVVDAGSAAPAPVPVTASHGSR